MWMWSEDTGKTEIVAQKGLSDLSVYFYNFFIPSYGGSMSPIPISFIPRSFINERPGYEATSGYVLYMHWLCPCSAHVTLLILATPLKSSV